MEELLSGILAKKDRLKQCVGKKVHLYLDNDFSFEGNVVSVDTNSGEIVLVDPNVKTVEKVFLYVQDIKAIMIVRKTLSEVLMLG